MQEISVNAHVTMIWTVGVIVGIIGLYMLIETLKGGK